MKVLLLSTSLAGGAGGNALALQRGLRRLGVSADALIERDEDLPPGVTRRARTKAERFLLRFERAALRRYEERRPSSFSIQWAPSRVHRAVAAQKPDVINLHWICGGFVPVQSVPRLGRVLVWTLHDMWPFTGGCHFAENCERYTQRCGACPQLASSRDADLSRRVWTRKQRAWRELPLTVVCPSNWLADCAKRSALFGDKRVEVIPYGIDTDVFRPIEQGAARAALGLPQDVPVILFGAWENSRRKGMEHLTEALAILARKNARPTPRVLIFGFPWQEDSVAGMPVTSLGRLEDPSTLARAYAAADVFVHSSIADNLPTSVIESLACGTPCAAFRVGGLPDLIDHELNGYLAQPFDPAALAEGIQWVLAGGPEVRARARQKVEAQLDQVFQAQRYRDLFADLLQD
jgi:glycosyltransferase involved in cell wall biosynthesis